VKLVGPDVLPDSQRLILFIAEIFKDGFLAQSAFDENDMYCSPEKQVALLRLILTLYHRGRDLVQEGVPLAKVTGMDCVSEVLRAKAALSNKELHRMEDLARRLGEEADELERQYMKGAVCHE